MNCALLAVLLSTLTTTAASEFNIKGPRSSFLQARAQSSSGVSLGLEKRLIREDQKSGDSRQQHKVAYFGQVSVGSPAQQFSVVYDTGSGNLIVPGSFCVSEACQRHNRFDANKSSSSKRVKCYPSNISSVLDEEDGVSISFGTGEVTGRCYNDRICIGSACSAGDFIVSTEESDDPFASFNYDGVLGLSLPSNAQGDSFHMMQRMIKQEALKKPLFSVFLSDSDQETSEITFGDIKNEHMASDLVWVPVTGSTGYWEVKIDDITLGNTPQSLCEDCRVAVDTGTSQLAGPSDVISKLKSKLDVKPDCSNFHTLPRLGFIVGGTILHLEPRNYVDKSADCSVSLMELDVPPPNGPLFILGIPFLQKYYSVYDHENYKVGFALAKHIDEPIESLVTIDSPKLRH